MLGVKPKKICGLVSALLILMLFSVVPAAAAQDKNGENGGFIRELSDKDGRVLGVAFRGDTADFPENTLEGIAAAWEKGSDAVLVNVKKAACGTLILFADDNGGRMLKNGENIMIGETDYAEIKKIPLKNREGGIYGETDCRVPSVKDALGLAKKNEKALVLSVSAADLPDTAALITETGTHELCAVTVNDSAENINAALCLCSEKPVFIGEIRNNIIFKVLSFADKISADGASGVILRTTNRFGVNYYRSTLQRIGGKLRAVADLSDKETAGSRADCEKWWDDLISRGYSVIITREPALFAEYIKDTEEAKALLEKELRNAAEFPLPAFKKEFLNDYVKAYNDAVSNGKALSAEKAAALSDLIDARADLIKAVNDINYNYDGLEDGSAELNVTPASVFLCFFAAALVLSAEIYVFKKRKK